MTWLCATIGQSMKDANKEIEQAVWQKNGINKCIKDVEKILKHTSLVQRQCNHYLFFNLSMVS